jgi:ABC-2 type transport system permease protein
MQSAIPQSSPIPLYRTGPAAELRAFRAVVRREWTIFRRYPSWIVAMFVWPVIFPLVYVLGARALAGPQGAGLAVFQQKAGYADYIGYIAIGTTIWMWQNIVLWDVGFALRNEQMRGTLEANWLAPAWRFTLLLGASMVQMVTMLVFIAISVLEFGLLYGVRFHGNPLLVLLVMASCVPAIYGLGIGFASLVITAKEAHTFVFLLRAFVMIFCGITFPLSVMPDWMQGVARWLPQTYMMDAMRLAALGGADFAALWPYIQTLLLFGAFWLAVGFALFNWMERRARRNGTIGHF